MVNLVTADISDSVGAQAILDAVRRRWRYCDGVDGVPGGIAVPRWSLSQPV
jgi:hypothetical protein